MRRLSPSQRSYLAYIREHPGCCIADVDRACRRNPLAGHRWVYEGVNRLIRRGFVRAIPQGTRLRLEVSHE